MKMSTRLDVKFQQLDRWEEQVDACDEDEAEEDDEPGPVALEPMLAVVRRTHGFLPRFVVFMLIDWAVCRQKRAMVEAVWRQAGNSRV